MPFDQSTRDEKNNLVCVTVFESFLAEFILNQTRSYESIYLRVFNAIEHFVTNEPDKNEAIQTFLHKGGFKNNMDRYLYSVFSQISSFYPGYSSFSDLKTNFDLLVSDYFIKLLCDQLLNTTQSEASRSPSQSEGPASSPGFFIRSGSTRSPYNASRNVLLFSNDNRGVIFRTIQEDIEESECEESTRDLGIVSKDHTPERLINYFKQPIYSARFNYQPLETAFVARWLRERHLPIISGSSGSTDAILTRVLPLVQNSAFPLNQEEIRILIFTQACSMVANGHHSLFEAMLVVDDFGYKLKDTDSLLDFYLQCIPDVFRADPAFIEFLASDEIKPLLLDMPLKIKKPDFAQECVASAAFSC